MAERDEGLRYGAALDLIGELLSSPVREDWVAEAKLWMRRSSVDGDGPVGAEGFADILEATKCEEELLANQVAACGLAVSISRYWSSVSAFDYRSGLETVIDGLDALLKLSEAFEAKAQWYVRDGRATRRDMALWRVMATMTEIEVERTLLADSTPPDPLPHDDDGERISSGSIKAFRSAATIRRTTMRLLAKEMVRVVGSDAPIETNAVRPGAAIPALGLSGIPGLKALRNLLFLQWRRTEGLDPRFRLLPKPAMVAALAGLCLKDAWVPTKSLPVQIHDKAPRLAGLLYRMAGEENEPEGDGPGVKDEASSMSMERAARAARKAYLRLRRNPLAAPGREDAWERRSATPSSS
jgi:hypothetical protein